MNYYLTTPIYYTNGTPHIGHTYSTIVSDVLRRFKRMQGYHVVVTTGTDEHGVNVERAAQNFGKPPREFVDLVVAEWKSHWDDLGIQGDRFIRTSSEEHHRNVQWFFEKCRANGYVYKGTYTGQYCIFDNLYVNEAKPGDPCPECGRPTETVTEENFFFKLSAFQDRLLKLYADQPDFIQPESRRNEVIRFVEGGLADLSITRTTITWGIPVPGQFPHVFYVWFDALLAYLTGAGGPDWEKQGLWPADLHLIGKEILRFHAVFWPAFLMAAGLPLPKKVFAHGWLLFEQDKMSKSRGNIVRPKPIAAVMGMDPLRLFLLREIVFGQDGNFSYDALVQRYNADLANGIGNLASRTFAMINQYSEGKVPAAGPGDAQIAGIARAAASQMLECFDRLDFTRGMDGIWTLVSAVDKFIVERAPWKLAKDPASRPSLEETLYTAAEAVRLLCVMLYPVMPESMPKIWSQLGMTSSLDDAREADLAWGGLPAGQALGKVSGVFPRLDPGPAVRKMQELEIAERARQNAILGRKEESAAETPAAEAAAGMVEGISPLAPEITIDDFAKIDLRVGLVKTAEKVKGSDKLLHLTVDIGEAAGPRTIVAGIALAYEPETLLGRKVVIVANLAPRKLKGITSQGMIVAASLEGGSPVLASFLEDVPVGARLR